MRVEFTAGTLRLVGELRVPTGPGPHPALVFTGPFTGVKEQVTGLYAERLTDLGYVTLAFDHRNWGESDGQPRRHEDPQGKLEDLRAAVSYLRARHEVQVRRDRRGRHLPRRRLRAEVRRLRPPGPAVRGHRGGYNSPYTMRSGDWWAGALKTFTEVLERQDQGARPEYVPAVGGPDAAMSGEEPFQYYGTARGEALGWVNEVTRASLRELITMDNMMGADFLSPKPAPAGPRGGRRLLRARGRPRRRTPGCPSRRNWSGSTPNCTSTSDDTEPHVTQAVEAVAEFLSVHLPATARGSHG